MSRPPLFTLEKGDMYFVALSTGEVYQGAYRGFHGASRSYWFDTPAFASATCGPQWVPERRLSLAISLGRPDRNADFCAALEAILQ